MDFDLQGCDGLLMVAASERDADLFYATHFRAPDPFVHLRLAEESLVMVSDLELGRARDQAAVDHVIACSQYEKQVTASGRQWPGADATLLALLRDAGIRNALVPADFPLRTADFLRAEGVGLQPAPVPLFPQRQIKSPYEVEAIRRSMQAAERSMDAAVETIRRANVRNGALMWNGEPLTSQRLRRIIHMRLLEQDCLAAHTIVAGGDQGCDPHQEGCGGLRAGESIIIDIFPQSMETGYFGDITRTVVRGPAPADLCRLYATVQAAQVTALERIAAGVDGTWLHQEVQRVFADSRYVTGQVDGHMQGFFHGTGHGVGLEIHESPRIGVRGDVLQSGHVVTVEPGLYYPGLGGVRLEDTVVVRDGGCENLTTFPKFLQV